MTMPPKNRRDVRMRGFAERSTVAACWTWIDTHATPLESELIPLDSAATRVLAEEIRATSDVPPFDRSAMDGYAVRATETIGASEYNPLLLQWLGDSLPGHPFAGVVQPGSCVRIMTGAPLPAGADAVVPAEFAQETTSVLTTSVLTTSAASASAAPANSASTAAPSHPDPSHPAPSHPAPSHPDPSHPDPSHPDPSHRASASQPVSLSPPAAAFQPLQVQICTTVPPGKNIGPIGEDVRAGTVVAHRQRRLRPQDLGVLASLGLAEVPVVRRPRVRLIITGNELVPPGTPRGPHQIVDANSSMLRALIERDGGQIEQHLRLPDDPARLREALTAPGADVILISGGSSVGAEDHAPALLADVGELAIHGIAMRPSSPAGLGRINTTLVFLLPGNPVSCLCAYDFFAGRALRLLGGRSADWPYATRQAPLARKVISAVGRVDYTRVQLLDNGQIEPLATSGASILSSTTRADGFLIIPAEHEGYPPGTTLTVYLYDPQP